MRILLLMGIIFLLDFYIFREILSLFSTSNSVSVTVFLVTYWLIPLLLFLLIVCFYNIARKEKPLSHHWRTAGSFALILYLGKILTVISLLLGSLIWLVIGWIGYFISDNFTAGTRPEAIVFISVLIGIIPVVLLTYGMLRNKYRYRIFREKVKIPGLPAQLNGLKIVQISDIHAGSFTAIEPVKVGVKKIIAEAPDLFFFTGDLVNTVAREVEPFVSVFSKIKAKYGVYSIMGNHDYGDYARWPSAAAKSENRSALEAAHQALGWNLLNNENEIINIRGAEVAIIGVENFSANRRFSRYGDLKKASLGTHGADLRVCLSHDPSHWSAEIITEYPGIELTLSGHTHGGQFGVEIFNWKWSPVQYFYKYWAGLYQQANQYLYVNRGFGFLGYPGRVGILPEITVLELEADVST